MKSLKRTLSLVLVLVMVLGLFGVAGAAFTDDKEIQYKEAVDVMTGIGAIAGMGDGNFAPKGNLTRAQAAKMVTYAILGKELAETLPNKTSSFTDVTAAGGFGWAIPSIEYLKQTGIVVGRGDGIYDPNGNVTGYELGKMLLAAIGYGHKNEFAGPDFSLGVALLANKTDIFVGRAKTANKLGDAASREEAALYCFNALTQDKAAQVTYSKTDDAYSKGKTPTTIGTEIYDLAKSTTKLADAFGRPATVWTFGPTSKEIATATKTAAYTFKDGFKMTDVIAKLAKDKITIANDVEVYSNGLTNSETFANYKTDVFGAGVVFEFYLNATGTAVDRIVSVHTYFGKVTTVTPDRASTVADETALTMEFAKASGTKSITVKKTDDLEGFDAVYATAKVGSYVLGIPYGDRFDNNKLMAIGTPKFITGTMTASGTGYIKVDGTQYAANHYLARNTAATYANKCDFVFDAYGNVIAAVEVAASLTNNYAYIVKTEYATSGSLVTGAAQAAKAQVIFTDGTTAIVDMPIVKAADGKYYSATPLADGTVDAEEEVDSQNNLAVGNWFTYTKNTDGSYSFAAISSAYAAVQDGIQLLKGVATVTSANKFVNSQTVVTAIDANGVKTSYTGLATKDTTLSGKVLVLNAYGSSSVSAIYAVGQSIATIPTYGYYIGVGETTATGTSYKFYVDGEVKSFVLTSAPVITATKIFSITTTGAITTATPVVTAEGGTGDADNIVLVKDARVAGVDLTWATFGSTPVYYATGAKMFNVTESGAGVAQIIAKGNTVDYVTVGGKLTVAYITAID